MFFSLHSLHIEKQSFKINIQISSSQYSLRMPCYGNHRKRTFYTPTGTRKKASLTVEAAMVFPIFLFAMFLLIYGIKIVELQSKIQYALDETATEMAGYAAIHDSKDKGKAEKYITSITYSKTGASVIFSKYLKKSGADTDMVIKKKSGFSFQGSKILENDSELYLVVKYQISLPQVLGINIKIPCVQNAYTRGFTGRTLKEGREETIVYITTGQEVYHTNRQCTHLVLSIQQVAASKVNKKKYSLCGVCKSKEQEDFVYITSEGTKYHKTLSCKSLKRVIERVGISKVSGRRICKRCGN